MQEIKTIFKQMTNQNVVTCVPLKDGITNANFLINNIYVLRIKSPKADPFYDCSLEKRIEELIKSKSITVDTISIDYEGNKLSIYLHNTRYFCKESLIDHVGIAKKIKQLHAIKASIKGFDMFRRLEFYKSKIKTDLDNKIEKSIVDEIKRFSFNPDCLCHNDLVLGNILLKDNNIYLIDFEYAGLNDIYFDLASFISENEITSPLTIEEFLTAYFGNSKRCNMKKLNAYIHFLNLLWYYWAKYHYQVSQRIIFIEIAEAKLKSLLKLGLKKG